MMDACEHLVAKNKFMLSLTSLQSTKSDSKRTGEDQKEYSQHDAQRQQAEPGMPHDRCWRGELKAAWCLRLHPFAARTDRMQARRPDLCTKVLMIHAPAPGQAACMAVSQMYDWRKKWRENWG